MWKNPHDVREIQDIAVIGEAQVAGAALPVWAEPCPDWRLGSPLQCRYALARPARSSQVIAQG